jgi:hypothetical protein
MAELETRLRELRAVVDLPPTPPIAARVGRELRDGTAPPRRARGAPRLRLALAAAVALLLLAAATAAAVPSVRHAVLDFFGLRGETIQRVPRLPENARAKPGWHLGRPTTLEAAEEALPFPLLLPGGLGDPNGVFVSSEVPRGALSLTYAPRPGLPQAKLTGAGLLVNELNGHFAPAFHGKLLPPGARIERFGIGGRYAIWIEGLHLFFYKPAADHTFHIARSRLATNALLIQRGEVMVRLEANFGKATAVEIARSLRPVETRQP